MKREVVVTGIGAVSPLGVGAQTLYERWRDGTSGIENGEGTADEFDPTDHLSVKEARRADRFAQFAMVAGTRRSAGAGWERGELPYDTARIGMRVRHRDRRHRHAREQQADPDRAGRRRCRRCRCR